MSRGLRRKSGGGARNEQRRNPGRLVCTPAGGAGKRWKDCKLLEISLKESNADEIGPHASQESGKWLRTSSEGSKIGER